MHVLQVNELNLFFGKIIDHLRPNKAFENYYPQLQNIIEKIVAHTQDFESLLAMVSRALIIFIFIQTVILKFIKLSINCIFMF